jgi:cell wall integrity and stress response component
MILPLAPVGATSGVLAATQSQTPGQTTTTGTSQPLFSSPQVGPTTAPAMATPTVAPIQPSPSPTTHTITNVVTDLKMTLHGVSSFTQSDATNWETITSLYQVAYWADGTKGVDQMNIELHVQSFRRRRLQSSGNSVTLVYSQNMTYILFDPSLTPSDLVTEPLATQASRDQYVTIYLKNVGGGLALNNVTSVSPVTDPNASNATSSPASSGAAATKGAHNNAGGLSGGAIAGIVIGILCCCAFCCLFLFADSIRQCGGGEDEEEEDEEQNPYIPPSPDDVSSLGGGAFASNEPFEYGYKD